MGADEPGRDERPRSVDVRQRLPRLTSWTVDGSSGDPRVHRRVHRRVARVVGVWNARPSAGLVAELVGAVAVPVGEHRLRRDVADPGRLGDVFRVVVQYCS